MYFQVNIMGSEGWCQLNSIQYVAVKCRVPEKLAEIFRNDWHKDNTLDEKFRGVQPAFVRFSSRLW